MLIKDIFLINSFISVIGDNEIVGLLNFEKDWFLVL